MEIARQVAEQLEIKEGENDSPDKPRRVRWSIDLEEVHYFVPLPQKTHGRWKKKMKCFKEKALDLTHKPMILLCDFYDSNTVHLLHSGLESLVRKVNGRSDSVDFDDIRDINKPWDELFEQYTTREEVARQNESVSSQQTRIANERIEHFS